ncbi:hypothetical protein ACEPAH_5783 [Sanghuangporus vaninii]
MPPSVPSTPFPVGSLHSGRGKEASPSELLIFLETLIAENLSENNNELIPASARESWATIIEGLSEHFLATFPKPRSVLWNMLHEKIKLCATSLTVIERAAIRVEGLFSETDNRSIEILRKVSNLLLILEAWSCSFSVTCNKVESPSTLRDKLVKTMSSILRAFARSTAESLLVKNVLEKSLETVNVLLDQMSNGVWHLKLDYGGLTGLSGEEGLKADTSFETSNQAISCHACIDLFSIAVVCFEINRREDLQFTAAQREIVVIARSMLDFLLSTEMTLPNSSRLEALASFIRDVHHLYSISNAGRDVLASILTIILVFRLREGLSGDVKIVDNALCDCFSSGLISLHPQNSTSLVLELVLRNVSEDTSQLLLDASTSAIRASLKGLDQRVVESLKQLMSKKEPLGRFGDILAALDTAIRLQESTHGESVTGKRKREDVHLKGRLVRIIQDNIYGEDRSWIPSDESSDASWLSGVMEGLRVKLTQPLSDPSAPSRIKAIRALKLTACTLAHPADEDCCRGTPTSLCQPPLISLMSKFVACLACLHNGPEEEVTSAVSKSAQEALSVCLRHHTGGFSEDKLNTIIKLISQGMQNQDRSVRLASGRSLVELIRLYERIMRRGIIKRLTFVFDTITLLLSQKRDSVKETTLISLGSIGKTGSIDVLGKVLFIIVTQLEQSSILLRGIAYMQLLGLAKYHKKTPYLLFSPFLEQISTFVVSTMPLRPNAMLETCRFLSLSPSDFLSVTLPYTLPRLFGTCNSSALEHIHKELGKSVSTLFLNASADILAHVFLLKNPDDTDKALSFILSTLSEAANRAKIGLGNVVKSCIVPLLGKLVVKLGDEDREVATDAVRAIRKVERTLAPSTYDRQVVAQHIGSFLKMYMLGIIALLNDILQDVQGRKTDDMKRKVLLGLNALVKEVGSSISAVAPQIMATLQSTIGLAPLSRAALLTWHSFTVTLSLKDLGPHVGPTTAALVHIWPSLGLEERELAKRTIDYILNDAFGELGEYVDDIVDFSSVPELQMRAHKLREARRSISIKDRLERVLERTYSDNNTVVIQALEELRTFMLMEQPDFVQSLASGDAFDPLIGQLTKALLVVACRDGDNIESLRLLAFDCLGILGAVDPDRFDIPFPDDDMIVLSNFRDENEAMDFAKYLIQNTLVGAFRSTSDLKYQSHLAFAIQELLKFCRFTSDLAIAGTSVPLKVRNRWSSLPKHVLETVTPLLEGKFAISSTSVAVNCQHPIYPGQQTYREWLQLWTAFLIGQVQGVTAKTIFDAFRLAVRNKDVGVAHQLLPHLVLNILISGSDDVTQKIRNEIVSVLEDQLDATSDSSADKRLLSAQAIFMLMDHLNKWIRIARQHINGKRGERRRIHHDSGTSEAELEVTRVDSILASIDQVLIAKAAFQCKSYARSLVNFEKQIVSLSSAGASREDLQEYYDRLHEIYSHLDEPDGMEGISAYITLPSIEHQIRQHESTGRWTSAQSCWEVRLQQSPNNLEYHLGLLRCLRNLGHYDSLRTHIQGILVRNPQWEDALAGFRVEGAWMSEDWDEVQRIVGDQEDSWEMAIARLLLALKSSDDQSFANRITATRLQLGVPITAAGERGYRRAYDAILKLHMVRDIEIVRHSNSRLHEGEAKTTILPGLFSMLSRRLDSTLPSFRTREPILSIHRTTFSLSQVATSLFKKAMGRAWLDSAKIARKAGHWQTAYSAILQARECDAPLTFFQSAKLVKASGEPLRALYELENALKTTEERRKFLTQGVIDLTEDMQIDDDEKKRGEAKARLLRAKWMRDSGRYDASVVAKELSDLTKNLSDFESAHYHAGHFQDECYKALSAAEKRSTQGPRMNLFTVKSYATAIRLGSKYAYQTIPRLLTIWLDMGEDDGFATCDQFIKINEEVQRAITRTPVYKWMTAFPQIVSRVEHKNNQVFNTLSKLIATVLQEYPQQGLWLFVSAVKSNRDIRTKRGKAILDQLRNNSGNAESSVPLLVDSAIALSTELLRLCERSIKDDSVKTISMSKTFPSLARLAPSPLIVPLQESMTVSLPATSSSQSAHQPFPLDVPTIAAFFDEIDIMKSLAKPRKITLQGSDGKVYMFLGKPKDDLRKDARLMDFNSIINKLLKTNSESRRRQLHIRTYSVVTLNEECGLIQWVPNTMPIRPIILKYYSARGIEAWNRDMTAHFAKIKDASDKEAAKIFKEKILCSYPPLFHEWFLDTFPEPTAWFSSRLAYGRTLAVMSMVGFILGLGDRHLENILLDVNTGDVVHVDFNCLFEKGKSLEVPERVPFRLTQNIVEALGVSGVEGVFRKAAEITLQLLRDNKDILMSVLDAFIHDPLVEWEDEQRKMELKARRNGDFNAVRVSVDLRRLAKHALTGIESKLRGMYTKDTNRNDRKNKEISTSNLVQILIEEATDLRNLSKMYPGWAPWH